MNRFSNNGSDDDDRYWMTPLLNEIAEVAGISSAIAIGRDCGGRRIYIPKTFSRKNWLTQLVGPEAAQAIIKEYGTTILEIPAALIGEKRQRAMSIVKLSKLGYSYEKIAHQLGISLSTVKNHLGPNPKDDRQLSLFDR